MRELLTNRSDLRDVRIAEREPEALAEGAARLRLDLFSLTSNNVTYAVMGEGDLGYWDFFPSVAGWAKTPCWGFSTVVASNAPGVEIGARFYGFHPIAETVDVKPIKVSRRGFVDGAAPRAGKAAVYNIYQNTASDLAYDAAHEPEQTLFRPLYATGWWLADRICQGRPRSAVLTSASAKTALATAHRLRRRGGVDLVALTSARNADYVRASGLYDKTLTYEEVDALAAPGPAVFADFLGSEAVSAAAHRALGDGLVRSLLIGATDWSGKPGGVRPPRTPAPGPAPEFFFVPGYAAGRLKEEPELSKVMLADLLAFYADCAAFVTVRRERGAGAVLDGWRRLLEGAAPPSEGLVASFD